MCKNLKLFFIICNKGIIILALFLFIFNLQSIHVKADASSQFTNGKTGYAVEIECDTDEMSNDDAAELIDLYKNLTERTNCLILIGNKNRFFTTDEYMKLYLPNFNNQQNMFAIVVDEGNNEIVVYVNGNDIQSIKDNLSSDIKDRIKQAQDLPLNETPYTEIFKGIFIDLSNELGINTEHTNIIESAFSGLAEELETTSDVLESNSLEDSTEASESFAKTHGNSISTSSYKMSLYEILIFIISALSISLPLCFWLALNISKPKRSKTQEIVEGTTRHVHVGNVTFYR